MIYIRIQDDSLPPSLQDMHFRVGVDKAELEQVIANVHDCMKTLFKDWAHYRMHPDKALEHEDVSSWIRRFRNGK